MHADAFDHTAVNHDWKAQVHHHSLGWICGRTDGDLVGFANVAWDGGVHAFLLDVMVLREFQGAGVGRNLVSLATAQARVAGCEWLHVDFVENLSRFYIDACGFKPATAGLIRL